MATMKKVLDVNLYAPFAMTKMLLPSLIKGRGRVINIASLAGKVSVFGGAAYAASKHGMFGFSNTIRAELFPLGIDVITIAPGFMKTPIVTGTLKTLETCWQQQSQETRDLYGAGFYGKFRNHLASINFFVRGWFLFPPF